MALNRQQRRAQAKVQGSFSKEYAGLVKNGITPEYVKQECRKAYQDGFREAGMEIVTRCYAAVALVLQEKYEWTQEQILDALKAVHEKTEWALCTREIVDSAFERTGIEIDFDGPVPEVRERTEK